MKDISDTLNIGFNQKYACMGEVGIGIRVGDFMIFTSGALPMLVCENSNYWGIVFELMEVGGILSLLI